MKLIKPQLIFCDIDATVTDDLDHEAIDFREVAFSMFAEKIAYARAVYKITNGYNWRPFTRGL